MVREGDIIGQFRLVRLIGEGGMGAVFEAVHSRIKSKRAAVKVLHGELAYRDEVVQRFEREAEAAAAIGHEGIIDVYDLGRQDDGAPYLVMELLSGRSLEDEIAEDEETGIGEPLDVSFAVFVACNALSALSAAHGEGIVHRDLKPDNVFLVETGAARPKVKLLDFGIARITEPENGRRGATLTRTGMVLGTPYFMSPEQALGRRHEIDQRTDLWAMGVILYRCLTGRYPFDGENVNQIMVEIIMDSEPAETTVLNPEVPEALEKVIARALQKDLSKRYSSAEEMLGDLRPLLAEPDRGLLDYHAVRISRPPASEREVSPDEARDSGEDVARASAPTRLAPQDPDSTRTRLGGRRRSVLLAIVLGVALVVVLGVGGVVAALVWGPTRGEVNATDPPRSSPAPSTNVERDAKVPPSAPQHQTPSPPPAGLSASPVAPPLSPVPPATPDPAIGVSIDHGEEQEPSTSVESERPSIEESEVVAGTHEEPDPVEPRPETEREPPERYGERAERPSTDAPRAPAERPRTRPPPRDPPSRPPPSVYGRELPSGSRTPPTPVYGREL